MQGCNAGCDHAGGVIGRLKLDSYLWVGAIIIKNTSIADGSITLSLSRGHETYGKMVTISANVATQGTLVRSRASHCSW